MRIIGSSIKSPWAQPSSEAEQLSLWDIYPLADLVTFPSRNEGFGNALLEAIYFRKPVLVNRYDNFIRDIEPCGFDLVTVNGFVDRQACEDVRHLIESPERQQVMTRQNYRAASKYFSYNVLEKKLSLLIENLETDLKNLAQVYQPRPSNYARLAN